MISKKILVQSATAGLMAGAVLAMPLFLVHSSDFQFDDSGCPYAHGSTTAHRPCPYERRMYEYRSSQQVLRAAPPVRHHRARWNARRRTLAERNLAAKQALEQLHRAYAESKMEQRASRAARVVAAHTVATQVAGGIENRALQYQTNTMARCFGDEQNGPDRNACAQVSQWLRTHGPLIVPARR